MQTEGGWQGVAAGPPHLLPATAHSRPLPQDCWRGWTDWRGWWLADAQPRRTKRRPLADYAPCWADALLGISFPGDSVARAWESGEQGQVWEKEGGWALVNGGWLLCVFRYTCPAQGGGC